MSINSIMRVISACLVIVSFSANSELIGRLANSQGEFQAYYDTESDLTWLANANYAFTSGYIDTIWTTYKDGRMTWEQANTWADGLRVDGIDGWRLADTDLCTDYACYGGEMWNFFRNLLGGEVGSSIFKEHNANFDLFSNIQNNRYWSATEYEPTENFPRAWYLNLYFGHIGKDSQTVESYAWAVKSGDVRAVSAPHSEWLFSTFFLGLVWVLKEKSTSKNTYQAIQKGG